MRTVQIISINHLSHTTQERLDLNLSQDKWQALFAFMKYQLQVEGYVHLSTCNRVEVYFEGDKDLRFQVIDKWVSLLEVDHEIDQSRFKTYYGSAISIKYLLDLSVGTHSAIQGDDQIFAQLKKAFQESSHLGNLSTLLERAFQAIMKSHKQICKETNFCRQTVSLAYHSLKSIYRSIPKSEVPSKKVLIIGAGDMATQIVKYIDKFDFHSVSISNRTNEKAQSLSDGHSIAVIPYDSLRTALYDIVISCTDVGYDRVENMDSLDYYIDLSLRSSSIDQINIPHVLLHELQAYIKSENQLRFSSLGRVNRLLAEHATVFVNWVFEWQERLKESI